MRAMQEITGLSVQKLAAQSMNQPKCYGVAKNFFTQASKADPNVVKPAYPYMFHKPFSW